MDAEQFIVRWSTATISERAHYQTFVSQLCTLIGAPAPDEERAGDLDYCFERPVRFSHEDGSGHVHYIDCYRRDCFVLEAKQSGKRQLGGELDPRLQLELFGRRGRKPVQLSSEAWDRLMRAAKRQAEGYAKALDEWPPFLIVVDVGRAIELWSDFGRQGKAYAPFPDRARYRIELSQLADPQVRERLRQVWTQPMALDPAARVAEVTTEIAARLAWLVRSIGARVPDGPEGKPDAATRAVRANQTALFVMQCIFAMFADSVGLIENRGFLSFLESYRGQADQFHKGAGEFFRHMDRGGHCSAIRQDIRRFNGGLFKRVAPLQITEAELAALTEAAKRDWASVETAIFGTLLEQALDPKERAELGAHYTPRAYVERLVEPTIMEPLRADWEAAEAEAIGLYLRGEEEAARKRIRDYHRELCRIRVLDPACGTGNFLYVAMRMMKELEGEVLGVLSEMGEAQSQLELDGHTVSPEQFWGLEKNANAAWIAEMVMWIGYLQWHFRVFGDAKPSEPILKNYERIQQTDALLSWSRCEFKRDARGRPTVWNRPQRLKQNGPRLFPAGDDEREVERYIDPRPTPWPDAHFIIGNPPFIGGKDMRQELGGGYVDALWHIRQGRFRSADLVTAWWDRAADILTRKGSNLRRFGFITTNSITQTFSRRVLEHHLKGSSAMRLVFAIPDHPWIRGADRASVRIAMTVAERGERNGQGRLLEVLSEARLSSDAPKIVYRERRGDISADLSVGQGLVDLMEMKANAGLCSPGVKLHGAGFIVTPERALALRASSDGTLDDPTYPYRNGRDVAGQSRDLRVIDLFGLEEAEVRKGHPGIYQHLLETVKPGRDRNNRATYRDKWWTFGEPRRELRAALDGLDRYIVTVETAKHRWFRFMSADVRPDNTLICFATDRAEHLAILSSRYHVAWARRLGGTLEDRPVYSKSVCFDLYAFPDLTTEEGAELAALGEELDELRHRILIRQPKLTMTALYNACQRLEDARPLTDQEQCIHESGHISLLYHLHRRIDAVVAKAYGWPQEISTEQAVAFLADLNRERAIQEAEGEVRFLRPDYQRARHRGSVRHEQIEAPLVMAKTRPDLPERAGALASALLTELRAAGTPVEPRGLAERFNGKRGRRTEDRIEQTLAVLAVAGSVQRTERGWYAPRR